MWSPHCSFDGSSGQNGSSSVSGNWNPNLANISSKVSLDYDLQHKTQDLNNNARIITLSFIAYDWGQSCGRLCVSSVILSMTVQHTVIVLGLSPIMPVTIVVVVKSMEPSRRPQKSLFFQAAKEIAQTSVRT